MHHIFSEPQTFSGETPTSSDVFWQFSKVSSEERIELIENATTGATFFLDKSITYGDFLVLTFLMFFLIFGIMKFLFDFLVPKLINFKR